jgi:hypothetical protein
MTLLNAPVYNEKKERTAKVALISGIAFIFLCVILCLTGFLLGHGWFFSDLPAEHRVNSFFVALEAKDYDKAFNIYNNEDDWRKYPEKHKDYPIQRFTEDWTTASPVDGPILSHHVDISKTDGTTGKTIDFGSGIIVAVRASSAKVQNKKLFMYYVRKDGTLTWPAFHELQY